jgi:hypothetical protein
MKKIILLASLCACTSLLSAQINVNSSNVVRVGNQNALSTMSSSARFGVGANTTSPSALTAMQFIPVLESHSTSIPNMKELRPVMVLTGLSNQTASIGIPTNQMSRVYSNSFLTNGTLLGVASSSDANLKRNVRELSSMTERVAKLRPVMYDFIRNGSGEDVSKDPNYKNRVGFIAQEVKDLFPDLVVVNKLGEEKDAEELLSLDYAGLIPYLTKTIQELNEKVEKLEQQISFAATFDIGEPNKAPQQSPSATMQTTTENNILFQNVPNPFNSATTITYRLAEKTANAKICIYNLTGKQLQCYNLPAIEGEKSIEVRASSLQSGMYLYSLIVDGTLIDTKRMVLTD